LPADDRRHQLEFRRGCRLHHDLCDPVVMKQLLIYTLALVVILGSATAASRYAWALLLIGPISTQSSNLLLASPGVMALVNTATPLKVQ
jgi:hypothetical protein